MNTKSSRNFAPIFLILIIILIFTAIFQYVNNSSKPGVDNANTTVPTLAPTQKVEGLPKEQQLEGKVLCLPHKDTSGPQTLECAFGIQTDDGKNYALDAGSTSPLPYNTGDRIRANGVVTPIEALSSDHWQKYDVVGIFSIRDSLEVL